MDECLPEVRKIRASSFDGDPELYARARPTYPPAIFDDLWRMASLSAEPSVVEVGCGTGQASAELARRGSRLTCIELGSNMANLARRSLAGFPNVAVINARFEDWGPSESLVDLVFAASSWHWIDPSVKYAKAASVLKGRGRLAVLTNDHAYPENYDRLFDLIQDVYRSETGSDAKWPPGPPSETPDHREELETDAYFCDVKVARHVWHADYTADEYVALLGTYSDNRVRPAQERDRLFAGIHRVIAQSPAGKVRKHYLSILRVGTRA